MNPINAFLLSMTDSQKGGQLPEILQHLRTVPLHVTDPGQHGAELLYAQDRLQLDVRVGDCGHVIADCRRLLLWSSCDRSGTNDG